MITLQRTISLLMHETRVIIFMLNYYFVFTLAKKHSYFWMVCVIDYEYELFCMDQYAHEQDSFQI